MNARLVALGAGLLVFSVLHTLLAAPAVRRPLEVPLGQRTYRSLYNLIAIVVLLAVFLFTRGTYERVWEVRGAFAVSLRVVQAGAIGLALAAWWQHNLQHFIGVRQRGANRLEPTRLHVGGPYAWCRHPLYLAVCVFATAMPVMDARGLVVAVWLWAYSWVGSVFEERKLRAQFGDAYRHYAAATPRLLPVFPARSFRRSRGRTRANSGS